MAEKKKTKKTKDETATTVEQPAEKEPDIEPVMPESQDDAEVAVQQDLNDMEDALKVLEAEKEDFKDALIRERADFENYKKRNASLSATSFQSGAEDTVLKMLPVLDNFERACGAECSDEAFLSGMNMIMRQFLDALKSLGVEEIDTSGKFDPEVHNAVMQVEEEGRESGDIVEVLQKGYSMNGRVLRHALVKVNM